MRMLVKLISPWQGTLAQPEADIIWLIERVNDLATLFKTALFLVIRGIGLAYKQAIERFVSSGGKGSSIVEVGNWCNFAMSVRAIELLVSWSIFASDSVSPDINLVTNHR